MYFSQSARCCCLSPTFYRYRISAFTAQRYRILYQTRRSCINKDTFVSAVSKIRQCNALQRVQQYSAEDNLPLFGRCCPCVQIVFLSFPLTPFCYFPSREVSFSTAIRNFSNVVNVISGGSPSRIRIVRRISFGITTLPRSSILLTIPVAFIYKSPLCFLVVMLLSVS